jgi:hypothetical protein
VAVDKFSKWIEARPIVNVRSEEAVSFFTDIIYCFGIPNTIITDNNTQFTGKNSSISATSTTSVWTGRLLHTRRQMAKSRGQTVWSYKA